MNQMFHAFLFVVAVAVLSTGCSKDYEKVTVIRDCTGDYIRTSGGKDYYVCNEDIISSVSTGDKIKVSYDLLEECFGILEQPVCEMVHPFERKVEITKIH